MRRTLTALVATAAVVAAAAILIGAVSPDAQTAGVRVPAGAPLPIIQESEPGEPEVDLGAPPVALAPPGGAIVQPAVVRLPRPSLDPNGQRRVAIQVGHWQTADVPKEYGTRIQAQTGTSWAGVTETDVTLPLAERIATLLEAQGLKVDILPTTIPEGYVADAFVAIHCDGDGTGENSGFKLAHGSRRGPYEDALLTSITTAYAKATGMRYDADHITRAMLGYYAFNWSRYQHATSAFTPGVIIELGYLSNDDDREILVDHADRVATGITNGILAFLDATPRSKLFGQDLLIPSGPLRQGPTPTPVDSR